MAMLQAADLSNKEIKSYEEVDCDENFRKLPEKNHHLLLKNVLLPLLTDYRAVGSCLLPKPSCVNM